MDESVRLLLYLGAGFLSGFLNTIASAGSAATLPLLVFMGFRRISPTPLTGYRSPWAAFLQ